MMRSRHWRMIGVPVAFLMLALLTNCAGGQVRMGGAGEEGEGVQLEQLIDTSKIPQVDVGMGTPEVTDAVLKKNFCEARPPDPGLECPSCNRLLPPSDRDVEITIDMSKVVMTEKAAAGEVEGEEVSSTKTVTVRPPDIVVAFDADRFYAALDNDAFGVGMGLLGMQLGKLDEMLQQFLGVENPIADRKLTKVCFACRWWIHMEDMEQKAAKETEYDVSKEVKSADVPKRRDGMLPDCAEFVVILEFADGTIDSALLDEHLSKLPAIESEFGKIYPMDKEGLGLISVGADRVAMGTPGYALYAAKDTQAKLATDSCPYRKEWLSFDPSILEALACLQAAPLEGSEASEDQLLCEIDRLLEREGDDWPFGVQPATAINYMTSVEIEEAILVAALDIAATEEAKLLAFAGFNTFAAGELALESLVKLRLDIFDPMRIQRFLLERDDACEEKEKSMIEMESSMKDYGFNTVFKDAEVEMKMEYQEESVPSEAPFPKE